MGAKPAQPSTAMRRQQRHRDPDTSFRRSRAQQDLEVMHEVVDGVAVRHDRAQAAGAIDHVDGRRMADGVAAVGVHLLRGADAVALLRRVDLARAYRRRRRTSGRSCRGTSSCCAASSRSGSTVTYTTCTFAASAPSFLRAPASVASVIGQTSPQLLKPNASSTTLPRKRARSSGLPSEPCSAELGRRHDRAQHAGLECRSRLPARRTRRLSLNNNSSASRRITAVWRRPSARARNARRCRFRTRSGA